MSRLARRGTTFTLLPADVGWCAAAALAIAIAMAVAGAVPAQGARPARAGERRAIANLLLP
ncbi:MAG: hypothetical protein M3Z27_03700, partial [Actinomycetota bacterium]|nr:hypothetical protein [Actinomycetota bacterium]